MNVPNMTGKKERRAYNVTVKKAHEATRFASTDSNARSDVRTATPASSRPDKAHSLAIDGRDSRGGEDGQRDMDNTLLRLRDRRGVGGRKAGGMTADGRGMGLRVRFLFDVWWGERGDFAMQREFEMAARCDFQFLK